MRSSAERLAAVRTLIRVESGAFASRLLAADPAPGVRARVLGVLRWMRLLDEALAPFLKRGVARLDPEVRAALRVGLAETMILGVPMPVATSEAVQLVRQLGKSSAAGLVNAVLRRAQPRLAKLREGAPPDVALSHPAWLWRRWRRQFGDPAARAAMAAAQEPATPWVWFVDDTASERLGAAGLELARHPWCEGAAAAPGHARELMAEAAAGAAYVQDPSSQLVALLALELVGDGARIVDLCSAPGGKAALMLRRGPAKSLCAVDLRLGRARLVRELVGRVGEGTVVSADAASPPLADGAWDLVLADAPCSGSGTLRRHPELKWRLTEADIPERAAVQNRILDGAAPLVAPGGVLLYATCSVEPEENEAHFAEVPVGFEPIELVKHVPENAPVLRTAAGGIRILPCTDADGFTMHALRRC